MQSFNIFSSYSLFVQYSSNEEAVTAVELLRGKIGTDGLRLVFESLEMKKRAAYALSGIDNMQYDNLNNQLKKLTL